MKTPESIRRDVFNEVQDERYRQIIAEGWSSRHDDEHDPGELAAAACCYAMNAGMILYPLNMGVGIEIDEEGKPPFWPMEWSAKWWKPTTPRRDLVKAAALILAEIEKIERAEQKEKEAKTA